MMVAIIGWSFALSSGCLGTGERSVFGQIKWSDFLQFYTLGAIARSGPTSLLYDDAAKQTRQMGLVPESKGDLFLGVYGPQTSILFASFSRLPYGIAGLIWVLISSGIYCWCVRAAWKPARDALDDLRFVFAAALAFPPAWQLAAYGQTTAIPLLGFSLGWLAVERGRPFLAGLALGLVAVKPQLGLVLAPVAIVMMQWRIVGGVVTSVLGQAALVLAWFGAPVFTDYWRALQRIPAAYRLLEPDSYKMHSIATLTELLPAGLGVSVWAIASIFAIAGVILVWRCSSDWRLRFGILVLASVLVSPHVAVYDLALLVLPALWLGGWMLHTGIEVDWFWQRCYWLAAATLVPTAALLFVQASVVIMTELFVRLVVMTTSYARTATAVVPGSSRAGARRRPASL